jgi:hypothetical protein
MYLGKMFRFIKGCWGWGANPVKRKILSYLEKTQDKPRKKLSNFRPDKLGLFLSSLKTPTMQMEF